MGWIKPRPVKRRRTKDVTKANRTQWTYHVKASVEYEVCRKAFMSFHGISEANLKKMIHDKKINPTGSPAPDKRGQGPSANKITGRDLECIHKHIKKIAVLESHYSRAHSPHRRYME